MCKSKTLTQYPNAAHIRAVHKLRQSFYRRQGGYVCFRGCLSVCLLATLRKNFQTDLHEIFREGWQWDSEQTDKFW